MHDQLHARASAAYAPHDRVLAPARWHSLLDASATARNGGANPASYAATRPIPGEPWTARVNLPATGFAQAVLLGYPRAARRPITGFVLLVDLSSAGTNLLPLPPRGGPVASFGFTLPTATVLCGLKLATQAGHFGGKPGFSLSNAQGLTFGLR